MQNRNTLMLIVGALIVVAYLMPALKALERERQISRIDDLTGCSNRRHLFEAIEAELSRTQRSRQPFTVAYLDLDGFKAVNDEAGHRTGDRVLCAVVDLAKSQLRKTDLLGRFGGDEFVVVLPGIGPEAARLTLPRIQAALSDEMARHGWPVTFSIGTQTYVDGTISADELIRRADELMYAVKKEGKNAIAFGVFSHAPDFSESREPVTAPAR